MNALTLRQQYKCAALIALMAQPGRLGENRSLHDFAELAGMLADDLIAEDEEHQNRRGEGA